MMPDCEVEYRRRDVNNDSFDLDLLSSAWVSPMAALTELPDDGTSNVTIAVIICRIRRNV